MAKQFEIQDLSKQLFGGLYRLDIMHSILLAAPSPEVDTFYHRQIADLAGTDPGNTLREFNRLSHLEMIYRIGPGEEHSRRVEYARLDSGLWAAATIALKECGIFAPCD